MRILSRLHVSAVSNPLRSKAPRVNNVAMQAHGLQNAFLSDPVRKVTLRFSYWEISSGRPDNPFRKLLLVGKRGIDRKGQALGLF